MESCTRTELLLPSVLWGPMHQPRPFGPWPPCTLLNEQTGLLANQSAQMDVRIGSEDLYRALVGPRQIVVRRPAIGLDLD